MVLFFGMALLMVAVAAVFILPPLLRRRSQQGVQVSEADREAMTLGILRDQQAELARERAEGSLTEQDYQEARQELQQRVLEELPGEARHGEMQQGRRPGLAVALLALLVALSFAGYGWLGNPAALDPTRRAAPPKMTAEQIGDMVKKLADRMEQNPDDPKGWVMLARSYKAMSRYEDAVKAYGRAEAAIADQPDLLADYAEAVALVEGGFKGKAGRLVDQVLKLDAAHPQGLLLAGSAAMERGDKKAAVAHWEKLLPMVEPGSDMDRALRDAIDKLKVGK